MRSKLLIAVLALALLPVTAQAGGRYGHGYYDRGSRYHGHGHSHSSFGFSAGYGGYGGYYGGYYGRGYRPYYAPRAYYPAPAYYYAPPVYAPAPYYYYGGGSCYGGPNYGFSFHYRR